LRKVLAAAKAPVYREIANNGGGTGY